MDPWTLPKFKVRYGAGLDQALSQLGMGIAFDPGRAQFTRMIDGPSRFYIGGVLHKTFLDVDEEGSTAAAVTGIQMKATAMYATHRRIPLGFQSPIPGGDRRWKKRNDSFSWDYRRAEGVRRSAFGVRRSAFGVRRSAFGVRRSAFGVRRSAFTVHPFGVRRSPVHRSAFNRSPFTVRRSAFGVRRVSVTYRAPGQCRKRQEPCKKPLRALRILRATFSPLCI